MASESNVFMMLDDALPFRCEASPASLVKWYAIYSFHLDTRVPSEKLLKCFIHDVYFITAESKLFTSKRFRVFLDDLIILPTSKVRLIKGTKAFTHKTSASRRYTIDLGALLPSVPHGPSIDAIPVPSRCSNAKTTFPEVAMREQN